MIVVTIEIEEKPSEGVQQNLAMDAKLKAADAEPQGSGVAKDTNPEKGEVQHMELERPGPSDVLVAAEYKKELRKGKAKPAELLRRAVAKVEAMTVKE